MTCTACDRQGTDCEKTFVCHVCRDRKNICHCMVGGFEAKEKICTLCHYRRETGKTLVSKYARHTSRQYQEA